ncbi:MAG: hypothetical protein PF549_00930 [Patescibacteria group bacterium]|nr:hypothetical protein [Patescibacteria group bacterium]
MKKAVVFSLLGLLLCAPVALADSGVNMDDVRVKLHAEQGGDWFRALTTRADDNGVVEAENVIPGWYKLKIDQTDVEGTQYVAVKMRMRDMDGKKLYKETPVDLYKNINDEKVFQGTVETDKKGWLEVENLSLDTEYKLEIDERDRGTSHQKDGRARIKVSAKIDDSDWFRAYYDRTNENMTLAVENVLPGEYKYRYNHGDRSPTLPFNLYARLVDEKGERLKEPTPVNLYAYVGGVKTPIGQVMTNARGEVFIPGVMTEMKYAIEVLNDNSGYMNR